MSFVDNLKKIFWTSKAESSTENQDRKCFEKISIDDVNKVLDEINTPKYQSPIVRFAPQRAENLSVFESKFGGVPYLPKSQNYPVSEGEDAGKPLKLLAQLNFSKLPHIEDFPESGILQFYCLPDDFYGADFDNPTAQTNFRIIFHKEIITDESQLYSAADMPKFDDDANFPFRGEFLLEVQSVGLDNFSPHDFRFEKIFLEKLKSITGFEVPYINDLAEDLVDFIYTNQDSNDAAIGGFPCFTQEDPRYSETFKDYTTTLLQIDSWNNEEIMWGDCGVANFFIKPEDLRNLKFDDVIYNWDCC